jgi:hypothetical protein
MWNVTDELLETEEEKSLMQFHLFSQDVKRASRTMKK